MDHKIVFVPKLRTVIVPAGTTVLQAGILAKAKISHKCGGQGSCGTCKVKIHTKSILQKSTKKEKMKLTELDFENGYRLACQLIISCNLFVEVPESALARVVREQLTELAINKDMQ